MTDNHSPNFDLALAWASYPTIWTPTVSGDGKWLVWAWAGITETANIWAVPTDGSGAPRMLTDGKDHFRISDINHDGSHVLLRQSIASDEHERLFLLDIAAGTPPTPLTASQQDHYLFGAGFHPHEYKILLNANCDPDGKSLPGSVLQVLDPDTGIRRVLTRMACVNENKPSIGMGGKSVLYHRNDDHPRGRQVWAVDWDGKNDRCVYDPGPHLKATGKWFGSQGDILILTETKSHDRLGLLSGEGTLRWLIDTPDRHIEGASASGEDGKILVTEAREGRLHSFILDVATGEKTNFGIGDHGIDPMDRLENGDWIARVYSASEPDKLVRTDRTGKIRAELAVCAHPKQPRTFTAAQSVNWLSSDGEPVQGWLYQPQQPSRGLVVWVHGGPTAMSKDQVHSAIQYLAAAGFTVLDPNYRGSTGFGMRFRNLIREDGWGGREQEDIRCGIEMLIAQGIAQPGKIGVAGQSYGGYSAWFAITRMRDLVSASCSICGMSDLFVDYSSTSMPHLRDYSVEMLGGTPKERPAIYEQGTLRTDYPHITGRLMIVHGLRDTNVGPENSRRASSDLTQLGIGHDFLTFADEGHGIYKQSNRAKLLAHMGAFFEEAFIVDPVTRKSHPPV